MKKYIFLISFILLSCNVFAYVNYVTSTWSSGGTSRILWFNSDTFLGQGVMAQIRYTDGSNPTLIYTGFVPGTYDNVSIPGANYKVEIAVSNSAVNGSLTILPTASNIYYEGAKADYGTSNNGFEYTGFQFLATGPLPVKLLNFKAYSENQIAHLSWETTEETNNESFEIQRSANAIDFVTIGQLKGNGTTNVEKSYKFTDISPINGLNYYRLKQNDRDGKFEFSKIISLNIYTLNDNQVITFPNPSNNGFRISNLMIGANITLLNSLGKKLFEIIANQESLELKTESFGSGIYFLNVRNPDGKVSTSKLVVK